MAGTRVCLSEKEIEAVFFAHGELCNFIGVSDEEWYIKEAAIHRDNLWRVLCKVQKNAYYEI